MWLRNYIIRVLMLGLLLCFLPIVEVGASVWQEPKLIDAGINNAYRTDIAFDKRSNALVVFEQRAGNFSRIYANRYVVGEGWQEPVIIDAGADSAYRGKVAFDKKGNAMAVFKQKDGEVYRIYANLYIEGKGWQKPVPIDNGPGEVDGQQVIFDKEGNAVAVFEQNDGTAYRIYVNRYINGKGWQGPVQIDMGENNAYFPYPVFDSDGNLHVIYYKELTYGLDVYVSKYDKGIKKWNEPVRLSRGEVKKKIEDWSEVRSKVRRGVTGIYNPLFWSKVQERIYAGEYNYTGWETPSKLDSRFRDAYRPSLIADQKGNITAFYVRWDGENLRGYTAYYQPDKGWQKPVIIDAGQADVEYLRAVISPSGKMALVFTQWKDDHLRVHVRQYTLDTGWGDAEIVDAGEKEAFNPSLAFTENDNIVVVWCQWDKYNVKSFSSIYKGETGWSRAAHLEIEDGETCGVKVAAGPDGKVIALFEQEGIYTGRPRRTNRIFAVELGRSNGTGTVSADVPYKLNRLTVGDTDDLYPVFSPDGKHIVFSSKTGKFQNIWIMDSDGSNRRQLTFDTGKEYLDFIPEGDYTTDVSPIFTPDGDRVIFASNRETITWDIWSIDIDGTDLRRLTKADSNELSPSITPDGEEIAFISNRQGTSSIWIMDKGGNNIRRLTSGGNGDWFPRVSPDGKEILFVSTRLGKGDIWKIDAEGKNYKRLTYEDVPEFSPTWSPDGTKIAYVRKKGRDFDIWMMDRDGSNRKRLTRKISGGEWGSRFSIQNVLTTAGYYNLSWHPDGSKLLFTTWNAGQKGNYITVLEFGKKLLTEQTIDQTPEYTLIAEKELTKGDWEDFGPSFSPDGEKLVFSSNRGDGWDIWQIDLDSEKLTQLTKDNLDYLAPVFSPDGLQIAYILRDETNSLWVMGSDGSHQEKLIGSIPVLSYPAWTPDGSEILFVSSSKEGSEIWTYNIKERKNKKLATVLGNENISDKDKNDYPFKEFLYRIDYSPIEDRIVFESNRSGNVELWTMNRDGSELTRITKGDKPHWNPVFSHDGKKIAYTTSKYGNPAGYHNWINYNIWIADLASGQEMLITGEEQADWNPVFSPDGKRIAYVTNRSGDFEHYSLWMLYLK
ncbi:MAG: TolB family protein [Thermodesulfobacteriota bacterium]